MYGKRSIVDLANLRLLAVTFFCLETKEPKVQVIRIASGRHSARRACVVTLKGLILQAAFGTVINIY